MPQHPSEILPAPPRTMPTDPDNLAFSDWLGQPIAKGDTIIWPCSYSSHASRMQLGIVDRVWLAYRAPVPQHAGADTRDATAWPELMPGQTAPDDVVVAWRIRVIQPPGVPRPLNNGKKITIVGVGNVTRYYRHDDDATATASLPALELPTAKVTGQSLTCPACRTRDRIVEVDVSLRENPISLDGEGGGLTVTQACHEAETLHYKCQACGTRLELPPAVDEWAS